MADTHIKIKPVTPRVQYTANGSTTVFPYSFAIFDETDMVVYVDDDIITTGYTVSGAGQTDGGNVTFDSAPVDGTIITLLRNVPIERMTDFQEGGTFRPKNLNDEFDRQTAFAQQVQEALSRCVKVDPTSESTPEEILPKIERLYDSADNIDIVANDKANVDAVAGNQTNIDAVAGNESNINTVAGISSDVSTVAGNATDVSNVATNMSDVNDCATNMAAIQDAPNQAQAAADGAALSAQYANDKINQTHISNCITYIPQDIKLTLSSGTLTVKAGTKFYLPDGNQYQISTDTTVSAGGANEPYFIFGTVVGGTYVSLARAQVSICYSGSTQPSFVGAGIWFDTANNVIRYSSDGGSTWSSSDWSLPLAICTPQSSTWVSIDQIFNGFGYIGATVFALPGLKGLIPNGRNADGTLKSTVTEITAVTTKSYSGTQKLVWGFTAGNNIYYQTQGNIIYDEEKNTTNWQTAIFASGEVSGGTTISNFVPKTVFHAVDYNDAVKYSDKEQVVRWGVPDLTAAVQTAANTDYTTPSNGFIVAHWSVGTNDIYINDVVVFQYIMGHNTNFMGYIPIPVTKGTKIKSTISAIEFYPCLGG